MAVEGKTLKKWFYVESENAMRNVNNGSTQDQSMMMVNISSTFTF